MLKRPFLAFCVIVVGSFGLFSWALYESSNERMNQKATRSEFDNAAAREMLRAASEMGRLAPLPKAHKHFKAHTQGNMFTRSFFITFEASSSDIEIFLSESEGIALNPAKVYSKESPKICFDSLEEFETANKKAWEKGKRLDYCVLHENWPEWWRPDIRESGRQLKIQRAEGYGAGELYINDQTGQVYIYVYWS